MTRYKGSVTVMIPFPRSCEDGNHAELPVLQRWLNLASDTAKIQADSFCRSKGKCDGKFTEQARECRTLPGNTHAWLIIVSRVTYDSTTRKVSEAQNDSHSKSAARGRVM